MWTHFERYRVSLTSYKELRIVKIPFSTVHGLMHVKLTLLHSHPENPRR
jgi:hypothetical protein